jgi:hypothetical protein
MPLPAPAPPLSCAICRGPLVDGPTIPTTNGGAVHVCCAEGQARAAARQRTSRAAVSAVLLLCVEAWALQTQDSGLGAVLAMLLIAVHVLINGRWWGYSVQSARLHWRRK